MKGGGGVRGEKKGNEEREMESGKAGGIGERMMKGGRACPG